MAGAYEGSGGIRVAGDRSACTSWRHHYRDLRDVTRDGVSGTLPRARVDSGGHTPQPGLDGCLRPEGIHAHAGRYNTFVRSGCPHRGRGRDEGGWGTHRHWRVHQSEPPQGSCEMGAAEQLARVLPRMPDKRAANLIATGSMVQRTACVGRVMDSKLSLLACRRTENG